MKHHKLLLLLCFLITFSSMQAEEPKSPSVVTVTVIANSYTWPLAISTTGTWVCGTNFGGFASYLWSAGTGSLSISGTPYGVSDNGKTAGTFTNSAVLYNGSPTETAGIWDHTTQQWTFLGMNPSVPLFATDYSSGWDITADGLTVVGMQWLPGYDVSAFSWSNAGGYVMIGNGVGQGSRASGISSNGTVVYGWAETTTVSRTPVIWYGGQAIFINGSQPGEAFGSSTTGNYVTGTAGNQAFRWTPSATIFFTNTLNNGSINPVTVTNDGEVFGYTDTSWPPTPTARRAFVRDATGTLMTFNDYAEAKGLPNAQQWIFYSINDATADGKKLLGAGKNPDGQNVTFIMEFSDEPPVISTTPGSVDFGDVNVGSLSPDTLVTIRNSGGGTLAIESVTLGGSHASQFQLTDNNSYPVSLAHNDSITVEVAFAPGSQGMKQATLDIAAAGTSGSMTLSGTGIPGVGMDDSTEPLPAVFPNPVGAQFTVDLPAGSTRVTLLNMRGVDVQSHETNGLKNITFNTGALPNGVYWVRIERQEAGTRWIKVVK